MSICSVRGCAKQSAGYGRYCEAHRTRHSRHGDPLQQTITAHRLSAYAQLVRSWFARQADDSLPQKAESVLRAVVAEAEGVLAEYQTGRPMIKPQVEAARDLVKIAADADPQAIIETVTGMVIMREREPYLFKSDRGFWMQVARRYRALTDLHVGSYWNHVTGKTHRVYRDPNPAAGEALGRMLVEGIGIVGLKINAADLAEHQRLAVAKATFSAAAARTTHAELH